MMNIVLKDVGTQRSDKTVRHGPWDKDVLQLPKKFEERTKGCGIVCIGWAPQLKILSHVEIGGFFTHFGWTSMMEAIQNEKPIFLLMFLEDQGLNTKLLKEKKMRYLIPRDELDGSLMSDAVIDSIRLVMVEDEERI
ncbi:hypothetical protein JHK86_022787 [Glycine max]|nr:hypothetical protein JHK86_022787 [Glycine max]